MAEGNWFAASEAFNKIRSKVAAFGSQRVMEVDYSFGLCYERLGRPHAAFYQYELVLQQDPEISALRQAGIQRVNAQRGIVSKDSGNDSWQSDAEKILKQPKDQQDVAKLNALAEEIAKKRNRDPTMTKLLEAQFAMMREDFDTAGKKLRRPGSSLRQVPAGNAGRHLTGAF